VIFFYYINTQILRYTHIFIIGVQFDCEKLFWCAMINNYYYSIYERKNEFIEKWCQSIINDGALYRQIQYRCVNRTSINDSNIILVYV